MARGRATTLTASSAEAGSPHFLRCWGIPGLRLRPAMHRSLNARSSCSILQRIEPSHLVLLWNASLACAFNKASYSSFGIMALTKSLSKGLSWQSAGEWAVWERRDDPNLIFHGCRLDDERVALLYALLVAWQRLGQEGCAGQCDRLNKQITCMSRSLNKTARHWSRLCVSSLI